MERVLGPPIPPLHAQHAKWYTLVGGPADGKKLKLNLKAGDMLHIPIMEKMKVRPLFESLLLPPRMRTATYRIRQSRWALYITPDER